MGPTLQSPSLNCQSNYFILLIPAIFRRGPTLRAGLKSQFRIILNLDLTPPRGKFFRAMKPRSHHPEEQHLTEQLGATGLRRTPQRQQVYDVLVQKRDHPTAEEVFIRAKK